MIQVAARHPEQLSYRPRSVDLPAAKRWVTAWTRKLAVFPGRTRMLGVGADVVLINAPAGIVPFGPGPPASEPVLGEAGLLDACPVGEGHEPIFIKDRGIHLYRWRQGAPPRRIWETPVTGWNVWAAGLDNGDVVLYRPQGGPASSLLRIVGAGSVLEVLDEKAQRIRWRRWEWPSAVLPSGDDLFVVPDRASSVMKLACSDGSVRWKQRIEGRGIREFQAHVASQLWLTTHDEELVALNDQTGVRTTSVKLEHVGVFSAVADEHGRLHVCNGGRYWVLDLRDGGKVLTGDVITTGGEHIRGVTFASMGMPTTDGRFILTDELGGVFVIAPGRPIRASLIFRARTSSPLLGCRVAHGMVYTLDEQGTLTALAPEGGAS
jgi:hypothetical protein